MPQPARAPPAVKLSPAAPAVVGSADGQNGLGEVPAGALTVFDEKFVVPPGRNMLLRMRGKVLAAGPSLPTATPRNTQLFSSMAILEQVGH